MNRKLKNVLLLFFVIYLINGILFKGNYKYDYNVNIDNFSKLSINDRNEINLALLIGRNNDYLYGFSYANYKSPFFIYDIETEELKIVDFKEFNETIKTNILYPYTLFKFFNTKDKLRDIGYVFKPVSSFKSMKSSYIYSDIEKPFWTKMFSINLKNILLIFIFNPIFWIYMFLFLIERNKKKDKREFIEEEIIFYSFISLSYLTSIPTILLKIYHQKKKWEIDSLNKLNILNASFIINIHIINYLKIITFFLNIYFVLLIYMIIFILLISIYYYIFNKIYMREDRDYLLIELLLFILIGVKF
ncbi:hypothetical protein STFE110948_06840 [Streptobacillus felis]|uniref:hypothetical protein n=1 Tax=Streptobacillus felis TaxID=1384509 RepID=UPI0008362BB6|nr:hypothetical protein [Streptobacillus felis]